MNIDDVIDLLRRALANRRELPRLAEEFQRQVWSDEVDGPTETLEILRDLAYDLDYMEPDPAVRLEDESFQDLDRATNEIQRALLRIRPL